MDLKQLEYIVAIEKYGNLSKAAQKLYITPSALNQQLSKLEKELNLELFTRNQRQLTPTAAGQIYLNTAREMLAMKQATYARLQDISNCQSGIYKLGLTYDHGNEIFAHVYPAFHRNYPGIELRCFQMLVPEIHQMLVKRQLDLALILTGNPEQYTDIEYVHFSTENLLLGLPASHPLAANIKLEACPYHTIDLSLLKDESFAMALKQTTMRKELLDPMFERAGFKPHVIMESCLNHFLEQLCASGICSCIIPQSMVTNKTDIAWFYLPGAPRFDFGVAYPKGMYINRALQNFIDLTRELANAHFDFPQPWDPYNMKG